MQQKIFCSSSHFCGILKLEVNIQNIQYKNAFILSSVHGMLTLLQFHVSIVQGGSAE
jgi:hypothetical protein